MAMQLQSENPPLTAEGLRDAQQRLGVPLPGQYLDFLHTVNVCRPPANIVEFGATSCSVSVFLGRAADSGADILAQNALYSGRIPAGFIAVALAAGGNLILLDGADGAVYFWDHEKEPMGAERDALTEISGSFDEFLQRMQPFDPATVDMGAVEIVSVQTKADFKSKFGRYM